MADQYINRLWDVGFTQVRLVGGLSGKGSEYPRVLAIRFLGPNSLVTMVDRDGSVMILEVTGKVHGATLEEQKRNVLHVFLEYEARNVFGALGVVRIGAAGEITPGVRCKDFAISGAAT